MIKSELFAEKEFFCLELDHIGKKNKKKGGGLTTFPPPWENSWCSQLKQLIYLTHILKLL
jgi:hypothetical protein